MRNDEEKVGEIATNARIEAYQQRYLSFKSVEMIRNGVNTSTYHLFGDLQGCSESRIISDTQVSP